MTKKLLLLITIIFSTFVVAKSYFHQGFPYTHDGENHLARFASYKLAVRQGQIPPRFAPNLMNNYGYPVFNFQYPLANIVSLPFTILDINPELTFKLIVMFAVGMASLGTYFLVRKINENKQSALYAAMAYPLSSYLFSAVIFRGNIGEILAFCFLPWVVYSLYLIRERKLILPILIFSVFSLSHNLSVVLTIPPILVLGVLIFQSESRIWGRFLTVSLFAIGLTSWFWLPAIAEKKYVNLEKVDLASQYAEHFISFKQLLFGPLAFGYSFASPVDSLTMQIGLIHVMIIFIAFTILFRMIIDTVVDKSGSRMIWIDSSLALTSLCAIVGLLFAQLSISNSIWQIFSFLKVIQFPWRLAEFIPIFSILLLASLWTKFTRALKFFLVLTLLLQVIIFWRQKPVDYFHKTLVDYEGFTESTSTQKENSSQTFTFQEVYLDAERPTVLGDGAAATDYWTGTRRNYSLKINSESLIIEPTMYFVGWQTFVKPSNQDWQKVEYELSGESQGRVAFRLPSGEYQVRSQFTQRTWSRMTGNSLFIFSVICLLSIYFYQRKRLE